MSELTDAKKRANEKWKNKNKDKQRVYQYRSSARTYVRKYASLDDLLELQTMISERIEEIKKA
ncbi:hypothetical protein SAMN05216431_1217 [Ligilactobacillus sp. WC1T17]|uniref:Phage protein n=1 Tax=Ligilactobacillus ruminis TaxID=1623 RepID=A0ABY1AEY7_9LACO|nr:hypothetical protein SAMN05216431_1217 [Ligilactobacillus ruminis]